MSKARKVENEDGSVTYVASDGREFKSKSGAWKHSTKIGKPVEEAVEPEPDFSTGLHCPVPDLPTSR